MIIFLILATFKNRQHIQTQQQQQYEASSSTTSSSTSLGLCQEIYYHDPAFSEGESILEVIFFILNHLFLLNKFLGFTRFYCYC